MGRLKGSRRDFRGDKIPRYLVPAFDASAELSGAIYGITCIARKIAAFSDREGMELMPFDDMENAVAYVRNLVDHWRPYLVCKACVDRISPNPECRCEGRGWLPISMADATTRNRIIRRQMRRRAGRSLDWMKQDIAAKLRSQERT